MNEQQRVFLAVLTCMGIFLGWQFLVVQPEAERVAASAPAAKPIAAPSPSAPSSPSSPSAAANAAPGAPTPPSPAVPAETRDFATPELVGTLSNAGAALTRLELTQYTGRDPDSGESFPIALVDAAPHVPQARIDWDLGGAAEPALTFADGAAADGLLLRGAAGGGLSVEVHMKPTDKKYALAYTLRVHNTGTAAAPVGAHVTLAISQPPARDSGWIPRPGASNEVFGLCSVKGDVERKRLGDVEKAPWQAASNAQWIGFDRQYFVAALVPTTGTGACEVSHINKAVSIRFAFPSESLAAGGTWEKSFSLYLGPKHDDYLGAVAAPLKDLIDFNMWRIPLGFLARPMMFLLGVFHGWTGSWGVAIMLLTLVVKTLLFPVTYKSVVSMRRMQLLKPELDRIKQQFENDRERQQLEQMKLFREKRVNPMGGCLIMLLQTPVWLALYRALWSAVDLYQQPFLWISDLTAPEPFPYLAIAVGGLTLMQQKLTPSGVDSQQAKVMMIVMPIMFSFFMLALPSGLVLYILVNAILTIVQQLAINRRAVTL